MRVAPTMDNDIRRVSWAELGENRLAGPRLCHWLLTSEESWVSRSSHTWDVVIQKVAEGPMAGRAASTVLIREGRLFVQKEPREAGQPPAEEVGGLMRCRREGAVQTDLMNVRRVCISVSAAE